jgi:hypothetical protein
MDQKMTHQADHARRRRDAARAKYKPEQVELLLVAEAPPCTADRYFYFEDVMEQDSLFRYVCKGVLGSVSSRAEKASDLDKLQKAGVHLIDVSEEPIPDGARVRISNEQIESLVDRCKKLKPNAVILIKSNVYDIAYNALANAGLNVINARMPFPGSGQQKKFETEFARALKLATFSC